MAKVLFTAVVADMRNKLNGTVFSKNRYGAYTRTKVTPVNPQSTAQQTARNNLSTNSQGWRGLSEAQRQSWIDAAPSFPFTDIFGNTKILSGSALYVKLSNNLANVGFALNTSAPAPVAIPAITSITLTAADAVPTLSLVFAPSPVPADFTMVIEATPNMGQGISFVKNRFRFIKNIPAGDATPQSILTEYAAIFGNPLEAQKIFVRVRYVSNLTGQSGIPLQTFDIVAP